MISVCIISLGRKSLYLTLESLVKQISEMPFEIVIILQGNIDLSNIKFSCCEKKSVKIKYNSYDVNFPENLIPIRVYNYDKNLGFGFYRNQAIYHSKGDILAWIDDDERTMDNFWLKHITSPIQESKFQVVTAGCFIPLQQGYVTDCISLLGYPGGGALGFEKVWKVSPCTNLTTHICSGNFAISRTLAQEIGFLESAKYGGEDNALASILFEKKIKILFEKSATVYHESRSLKKAILWWRIRAKSMKQAAIMNFYEESILHKKIRFIKNLLTINRYIFGKVFVVIVMSITLFIGKISE